MFAGGLILAFTLIGVAGWLQWTESVGWPHEPLGTDDLSNRNQGDHDFYRARKRSRLYVNSLIAICGGLILLATLAGPARAMIWASAWTAVAFVLMVVVVLAVFDGLRSYHHHSKKLREVREQLLPDDKR